MKIKRKIRKKVRDVFEVIITVSVGYGILKLIFEALKWNLAVGYTLIGLLFLAVYLYTYYLRMKLTEQEAKKRLIKNVNKK